MGNQIADVLTARVLSHRSEYAILVELNDHSISITATIGTFLALIKSRSLQLCQSGLLLLDTEAILVLKDVLGAGCGTLVRNSGLIEELAVLLGQSFLELFGLGLVHGLDLALVEEFNTRLIVVSSSDILKRSQRVSLVFFKSVLFVHII